MLTTAGWRVVRYETFQRGFDWIVGFGRPAQPFPKILVPRLGMAVLVVEGDNEESLALGAGHVSGSAGIGEQGNVVIAGHRDMAFRVLQDIKVGDEVRVEADKTYKYIVNRVRIVEPDDVSVLRDEGRAELTLITCYPFSFVGFAPQRYVVQARMLRD